MGRFCFRTCILLLAISPIVPVAAQENDFMSEFHKFRNGVYQRYDDFRRECNQNYARFLEQAWQDMLGEDPMPKPEDDKVPPVVMPDDDMAPVKDTPVVIDEVITPAPPRPQPEPVEPIKEKSSPVPSYIYFSVYNTGCRVRFDRTSAPQLSSLGGEELSRVWLVFSDGDFDNTLYDCLRLREEMRLCDWAYLNLLGEVGKACFPTSRNMATLFTAYLYCQSGYKMRLGRNGSELILLFASQHIIYGVRYYKMDGVNYYQFHARADRVEMSDAAFPEERPLSLLIPSEQVFVKDISAPRQLTSTRYPDMTFSVRVNKNLLSFFTDYPTSSLGDNLVSRWAMYANTLMEREVAESLYPAMRGKLQGLTKREAAEQILNWVQTAFEYKLDDEVWGGDRAFFSEESLYYPYCDCEDRSILFTRLVRDLLGLKCILIYYPGHLATAVNFTDDQSGDYIMLDGVKFTVCDPTYIGAPCGRTMPEMDNRTAKVILLE